ncbi:MAG: response regulator [Cyanobacteria bacterium J06643_4]
MYKHRIATKLSSVYRILSFCYKAFIFSFRLRNDFSQWLSVAPALKRILPSSDLFEGRPRERTKGKFEGFNKTDDQLGAACSRTVNGCAVLVVDDDADNLMVAQYAVESFGLSVETAQSGYDVLVTALTCKPELILLDICLDGVNGTDLLYQLKCHEPLAQVPVVAVTALAMDNDRDFLLSVGFSDYLAKPYMIEELRQIVKYHLPESIL